MANGPAMGARWRRVPVFESIRFLFRSAFETRFEKHVRAWPTERGSPIESFVLGDVKWPGVRHYAAGGRWRWGLTLSLERFPSLAASYTTVLKSIDHGDEGVEDDDEGTSGRDRAPPTAASLPVFTALICTHSLTRDRERPAIRLPLTVDERTQLTAAPQRPTNRPGPTVLPTRFSF